RQDLLLRSDVSRGEVEDAATPHRVLDGRARGRVERQRREHGAAGAVRQLHRRARTRALPGGAEGARARYLEAGAGEAAVPAARLWRRREAAAGAGERD